MPREQVRSFLSWSFRCLIYPRFLVRDFVYSEEEIEKQREELETADVTEKELWVRSSCPRIAS